MLRLRARNPTERVNSGLLQTFLKMYSESRDGVTAMLSYEQVNVRNGSFASVWPDDGDFQSTPVNGHSQDRRACLKSAKKRLMHRSN